MPPISRFDGLWYLIGTVLLPILLVVLVVVALFLLLAPTAN